MGRMSPHCTLSLRMVEGALLKGDWARARKLVVAWECPEGGGCGHGESCTAHRGYLHHVALTVKIMGSGGRAQTPVACHARSHCPARADFAASDGEFVFAVALIK